MIVSFGEALVDLFATPRGAALDEAERFVPCLGGAPANVAVVLARLGIASRFVGAVGRDAHGDRLARALATAGVDTAALLRVPERTGMTFVRVAADGARSFLFYRAGGADYALSAEHLAALAAHPLEGARWLHVNSSALVAQPLAGAARWLLDAAADRGVPVSLDLNVRPHLWADPSALGSAVRDLAVRAAWVKSSEDDLAALGLPPTLDSLAALCPGAVPVLTLAERGAAARVGATAVTRPAPRLAADAVVDATGAGDAFVAGVLATLWEQGATPGTDAFADPRCWAAALTRGCVLGARAVTALGATEALRDLADPVPGR